MPSASREAWWCGLSGGVALTFDDGPDPAWTPRVLDELAASRAPATFFVVAPRAVRHPALLGRAASEGHEVALHCVSHDRHDRMSRAEILADATEGLRLLGGLGHTIRLWRTPWGVVTPDTVDVARSLGLGLLGWTTDSEDWRGEPPGVMIRRISLADGAVVLMHDGLGPGATRGGCAETVALVSPLVSLLRSRDLRPVRPAELPGPLPDRNPGPVSRV